MSTRTRIVAGVVAAAGIAAIVAFLGPASWNGQTSASSKSPAVSSSGAAKTSSEAVLAIAPSARPAAQGKASPSAITPLMREFVDSRNDQAIYKRLMAQATWTAEEEYVLARILDRCADVTDRKDASRGKSRISLGGDKSRERFVASLSPRAPNRDRRITAFDSINFDECAGMEAVKTTESDIRAMYERSASRGDPKSQVEVLRLQLDDQRRDLKGDVDYARPALMSDTQLATWKGAFASADPRAIIAAVELLGPNSFSFHLRGPDEAPIDYYALLMASQLAACDLGRECGPASRYLQQGCALEGYCDAADVRDFILFYGLTPSSSQLAIQYQARLMDVIQRGDWSYFTVVRGPSPSMAPFQRR